MNIPDPEQFDESGVLDGLSPHDEAEFRQQYERNYRNIDEESVRENLKSNVLENARELVKSAQSLVGGFHPRRASSEPNTEYEFEFLSPLCEIGEDGGDILLARTDYHSLHICIVACEIGGEDRAEWVDRVNSIGELMSQNHIRSRITEQLNRPDRAIDSIQFVTLAREVDLVEFEYAEIDHLVDVNHYCVWERDRENQEFNHCGGDIVHQDLINCLDGGLEYGTIGAPTIRYLVGSNAVLPLEEVIYTIIADHLHQDDEHSQEFRRGEFIDRYQSPPQLGAQGDEYDAVIDEEVTRIIEFGLEIGLLNDDAEEIDPPRDYDIKFPGEKPTQAKGEVVEKYLTRETPLERGRKAFTITDNGFESEDTGLDDYF